MYTGTKKILPLCLMLLISLGVQAYNQEYSYDKNSNVTTLTTSKGEAINYEYDLLNRLTKITFPDSQSYSYEYDSAGRRTKMTDPEGVTFYAWDAMGRLEAVQRAGINPIYYYYDNNDRITSIKDPTNRTTYYGYDDDGNLKYSKDNTGFNYYSYDAGTGLLVQHDRLRTDQSRSGTARYAYDINRRLTVVTHFNQNSEAKAQYKYSYDLNENPVQIIRIIPNSTEYASYSYDAINRLTSVSYAGGARDGRFERFVYDNAGNIESRVTEAGTYSYSYSADNRLTSIDGPDGLETFEYDLNGNLIKRSKADQNKTYAYDYFNRLVKYVGPNATVEYKYDGDGNRLSKSVNGQLTHYITDTNRGSSQVLLEANASLGVTRYLNYGLELSSQIDASGTSYYLYDKPGRSIVELERDGNTAIARYSYSAFGLPSKLGTAVNSYQYTGEQYDEVTGLQYLRSRYYDPSIGRFISRDSFSGFADRPQSLNNYAYVENNPETYTDPNGDFGIIGACANVAIGYGMATLTGEDYSWGDAAFDAGTGFVGGIGVGKAVSYFGKKAVTKGAGNLKIGKALSKKERNTMNDIFKGNKNLSDLSKSAREKAAQVFDQTVAKSGQHKAGVAFNKARSDFLRGNGPNPGPNARDFAIKNDVSLPGKGGK